MKKALFILFVFIGLITNAQEWETNFEKAKKSAIEKNQPIVLVFQGSDWCAPCMKLEQEIWNSKEFKAYAKENFVLLKADFPRRRKNKLSKELQKHNDNLAERYNSHGIFPLVVVLNSEGKVLGTTGYKKTTPQKYISILTSFIEN
ncbi:MAG TPA: thioredoxin family protein [Flavobacteriaceae bacterium]|nr:thioredoxin family protein [Flavobacteriaceae bacterium]